MQNNVNNRIIIIKKLHNTQTHLHSRHVNGRELSALGVSLPAIVTDTTTAGATAETTLVDTNVEHETMSAATATKVNTRHDVADLSSPEGKKLCQKATEGLPNE